MKEIEMYKIYPNKNQPRKNFDEEKIQELADSIKKYGLLQPIILKEDSNGEYMIIAGERRFTACKKLGMKKIPAIIKDVSYEEIDKLAIIENLQREDLSPVEEAKAYKRLIEKYNLTQTQLSESVGKSRPYITNSMRLLNLCDKVLDMLDKNEISSGHGKVLLRLEDKEEQERLAKKIVRDKLSVRQLESIVNNLQNKEKTEKSKSVYEKDLFVLQAEDTMRNILGTKVNITKGKKSGKIEIEYYSDEDLEAIINMLLGE
ncbi:ParB/RepB/Spo0J family partition protein [Peptacetobacter sp. AB800]|uniref:ParB/RepB/Spo0J family partition protein n=1 Tax=Peptacetobacter sp. AB800 TaxID=3388428 RepID=UPI0039FD46E0